MTRYFPTALFLIAMIAGLLLPGEGAYFGAYTTMGVALLAVLFFGPREWRELIHPLPLAILAALALVCSTLPFVYRGGADLLAPVFILPMLVAICLGLLAFARLPSPSLFAAICTFAAAIALIGGAYEYNYFGSRVGMGNNPIHYGSLAAMTGGLGLIGVVSTLSPWRYLFLISPVLGIGATALSGSRGPLAGAIAMAAVGTAFLLAWFWHKRALRFAVLAMLLTAAGIIGSLIGTDNRVTNILTTGTDIFRFTGGSDDIRAALYSSALSVLRESPVFGVGYGQIMQAARELYPDQEQVFVLDNLHADWANFAAMGGAMGLVAWLLLLSAPLMLLSNRAARADKPIVLGAVLLTTGQAALGVSNAMFGILPQTTVFAVALGYLFARARQLENGGMERQAHGAPPAPSRRAEATSSH